MSSLAFAIVIHNHQPVGNFDHVIEDAYQRSYLPFLEALERRSAILIALHNSGCLWEWLEAKHPEYGERVVALVRRGQIKLVGGGYYEPILPLLPSENRRGQIGRMNSFLQERFGSPPDGMWLAERVWEPNLPLDLASQGIRWLCLDDTQFLQVGLQDRDLKGRYLTEDGSVPLSIYPTQMKLRYEIPFASPETVLETLRESADDWPGTIRVFADDGEKFGVWPGTDRLCYGEEHWLDRFFDLLERNAEWLHLVHLSEHLDQYPPVGRIYLPAGSYREMTEWALPPETHRLFLDTQRFLKDQGHEAAESILLKGGFFRNFLARYSESNQLHKRVIDVLKMLDATRMSGAFEAKIRDHLWRAQSNDAYWHGVFGGLYLPHLRDGLYGELLAGEIALDTASHPSKTWAEARRIDYDCDGHEEVILSTERIALHISPWRGGGALEIDDRVCGRNITNVLTRRPEAYHDEIRKKGLSEGGSEVRTIHDGISAKEEHLDRFLVYDRRDRLALIDRFFRTAPAPDDLINGDRNERGDFTTAPYRADVSGKKGIAQAILARKGCLDGDSRRGIEVGRVTRIRAGEDRFEVEITLHSMAGEDLSFHYGIEWLVNFLAGRAHDRFVLVDGIKTADPALVAAERLLPGRVVSFVDEWKQERVDITADRVAGWVRAPLVTVSLSEGGAESLYQGTILLPYWEVRLAPGSEWKTTLTCGFRNGPGVNTEPVV
jgi:4-alpha-glucanotransferase